MTQEICLYRKDSLLFNRVTECLNKNITNHLTKLFDAFHSQDIDVLSTMDTFWSTILRCITTVSSLLTHLSRGDQKSTSLFFSI